MAAAAASYHPRTAGQPFTTDFRIYLEGEHDHELVSPWHDVPLYAHTDGDKAGQVVNMVVEIPRFWNAKMEVSPPTQTTGNTLCVYVCWVNWCFCADRKG